MMNRSSKASQCVPVRITWLSSIRYRRTGASRSYQADLWRCPSPADILALFHAQFYENAPLIPKGRQRPLASGQPCISVSVDIFKQISVLFPRSE